MGIDKTELNQLFRLKRNEVSVLEVSSGRVLSADDRDKYIRHVGTSNITVSVPLSATVPFPIGTNIFFTQRNTGTLTLVAEGATSINTPLSATLAIAKQGGEIAIRKVGADTWDITGQMGGFYDISAA